MIGCQWNSQLTHHSNIQYNQASQSGLDAAKRALADCAAANQEIREQTPRLDGRLLATNLDWVRTAAQAAIALRIHGMLETTGMPSASARLQHASLPAFRPRPWQDSARDPGSPVSRRDVVGIAATTSPTGATGGAVEAAVVGFEDGVIQVSSELRRGGGRTDEDALDDVDAHGATSREGADASSDDDGYDLLPLPVPAPERRILMAGSTHPYNATASSSSSSTNQEGRFHYGNTTSLHDSFLLGSAIDEDSTVLLGTLSIDDNIDKLREVIGSVDNTLSRCLASGGGTGKVRRDRHAVQLDVVKGFDGWEGMRGQFISQRSLLKGVKGLEQAKEIFEEGDLVLIDGRGPHFCFFVRRTAFYVAYRLNFVFVCRLVLAKFVGTVGRERRRRRAFGCAGLEHGRQCQGGRQQCRYGGSECL